MSFKPGTLMTGGASLMINIGQPFGRDLIGLRHHDAVTVRVDEVRIDPARSGFAELREIQLARRQHHLAQLAVDGVAIDIGVGIDVGPVGLELRDGVVESVPIPEAHVVEQRLVLFEIDGLVGLGREFHLTRCAGRCRRPSAWPRYVV